LSPELIDRKHDIKSGKEILKNLGGCWQGSSGYTVC